MQNPRPDSGRRPGANVMRRWAALALVPPLLGALGWISAGAAAPVEPTDAEIERLRELHFQETEQVRLVLLPTIVTTRRGRPVQGLSAEDFQLQEDYVPQQISFFGTENDQPVSIAFMLDLSGSMHRVGKLDEAKQAIRVFLDALGAGDQFGLVCFADDQVAWVTDFTYDYANFMRRLEVQEAYGQTALFDALAAAPRLVEEQIRGRKAIVLFTDGIDNASELNVFEAVRLARSVNVPIYTIGLSTLANKLRPKGSESDTQRVLQRFSEETGGALFTVYDPDDLKEAVLEIQRELRFQYVIGYRPTRERWDGKFRRVKVETVRNGLLVRTRSGYYANP